MTVFSTDAAFKNSILILRFFAHLISIIFHPLLMATYMLMIQLLVNPYLFGINNIGEGKKLILVVFASTFFLPFFSIVLMKSLGMIKSFEMKDKQERIGPFISTAVFYLWVFKSLASGTGYPTAFAICILGATAALFIDFLINLFYKVSLHATGAGGLVGMVAVMMWMFSYGNFAIGEAQGETVQVSVNLLLIGAIFIAGLVGSARLILGAHQPKELALGYVVGFFCQIAALKILL